MCPPQLGERGLNSYLPDMNVAGRRRNREPSPAFQPDLLGAPGGMPEGFRYVGDLLSVEEEEGLARELEALPFKPFDFHGYEANRQVVGFGFRYDYSRREVVEAPPVPTFLDPVRQRIRRGVRSTSRRLRAGFDQRISPGRRHRLAPRQAAVRRGGGSFAAGSLQLPSSPQVGRGLGSLFTDCGAALRLHVGGSLADHLGAQRSATGSPSLLHHFSYARQVVNSLRKTSYGFHTGVSLPASPHNT